MKNYVTPKLSEIEVPVGRSIDDSDVPELVESIERGGLINPITVRRNGDKYILVCGANRYKAYELLERDEIECIVLDCDETTAELLEIDENLERRTLDWLTRGKLAKRRDEILDKLRLKAKAGDNQHTMRGGAGHAPPQTTADCARKMGVAPRTIQEDMQIVNGLVPEAMEAAEKKLISKETARKLTSLEPEEQRERLAQLNKKRQESQAFQAKIKRGEFDGRAYRDATTKISVAMMRIEFAMDTVQKNVLEILEAFHDIRHNELASKQEQEAEVAEMRTTLFEHLEHWIEGLVPLRDEFKPD